MGSYHYLMQYDKLQGFETYQAGKPKHESESVSSYTYMKLNLVAVSQYSSKP